MKDFRPMEWTLSKRLLATVAYFDVFEMPIHENDLSRLIWGSDEFNALELEVVMAELTGSLERDAGYYFLRGKSFLAARQKEHEKMKNRLLKRAVRANWILRSCPFVEFAAVCNYLPLGVVEASSDIDLLIVTRPGRIFTARLFLTILFQLAGRRRHTDKVEGRFCLSFYLNREKLSLAPLLLKPHDYYMAYWMLAILPVYGEKLVYDKLIKENHQWMAGYFDKPHSRRSNVSGIKQGKNIFGKLCEIILNRAAGNWLEKRLKKYFLKRHLRNIDKLPENASVEVSDDRLKFHNNDKRHYFRDEFEQRLKRLQLL